MKKVIINEFDRQCCKERPFIVAIDGLGGAGKTTFVKELIIELRSTCTVNVLHIDDLIVEREKRYNTAFDEWYEYYYLQWNIEFIKNELLLKLHNNVQELTLPFYDKSTNSTVNKKVLMPPNSILLIEGVFLQRNEWRGFYDYTIFLECPRVVREERVLKRDLYIGDSKARVRKYEKRYWVAEEYYLKKENPLQQADKIWHTI